MTKCFKFKRMVVEQKMAQSVEPDEEPVEPDEELIEPDEELVD